MSLRPPQTFLRSLQVACRGFCEAVQEQRNLRAHLVIAALVLVTAVCCGMTLVEWSILLLCIAVVFAVELLNTAIETVVDLVSPQEHELARKAKDISAASVLITTIFAVGIGILLFGLPVTRIISGNGEKERPLIHQEEMKSSADRDVGEAGKLERETH